MLRSVYIFLLFLVAYGGAFVPTPRYGTTPLVSITTERNKFSKEMSSSLLIVRAEKKKGKEGGLDETMRTKLVTESIAPWRTLRLFLYGALGSGAFIGGLLSGSAAIAGSASPEFNLNTEVRHKGNI
jgi:Low psii accumulation1 / Rep27